MRNKLIILILAAVLMIPLALSACGEKNTDQTIETSAASPADETTAVVATTAEGGTVEQDVEGNQITKDQNGTVISVKDRDGQPVDVPTYIEQHPWVQSTQPKPADGTALAPGETQPEDVEGEIPVVIATIPDDDELEELPDLDDPNG